MSDFDVIVLGGGSAGSSAAAAATEAGARTLMINDGELGGLCILRGCMPTKAMLASAHAVHEANHLEPLGARLEGRVVPQFDRIMERKAQQVLRFQRAKIRGVESQDYEVRFGRARFAESGGVEVDGMPLSASGYVIATGSRPCRREIPGIDEVPVWSSDDVMRLERQPKALLVQGAGPIALELAQFFARIGTRVLLVNRSGLLSKFDVECGKELTRALEEESDLELAVPGRIEQLAPHGAGLRARISSGGTTIDFEADALLMAVGREAALDDLGLQHVGLAAANGMLEHDAAMRTGHPEIFVAGDATGSYQVLHLSNQEGIVAGHNAAGADPLWEMDYRLKMSVIFSDPPFATVGMTEPEAIEAGHDLIVGQARFPETGRAITMETRHGIWRLFAERRTGRILGSSCLGPRADDLIHLISTMMHYDGCVQDILRMPWYHPTLSEVIINLGRDLDRQLAQGTASTCPGNLPPGEME